MTFRAMKIKKGDPVLVISGKDKGKRGEILRVFPVTGKVIVGGLHLVKKHRKPRRAGEKGQMVLVPRAVSVAKVQIVCAKCNQPTRIAMKNTAQGKNRICKKCGNEI